MNYIIFILLIGVVLFLLIIGGIILNYIIRVGDILAENQQKLFRQIDRKYNEFKESSKHFSAYERGKIDDIIRALKVLEGEKLIFYTEEINFLYKIRNW